MRPRHIKRRNELDYELLFFLVILLPCAAMYEQEGVTI